MSDSLAETLFKIDFWGARAEGASRKTVERMMPHIEAYVAICVQTELDNAVHPSSVEDLLAEVRKHHARIGIMASPTHWAYRGDWRREDFPVRSEDETPGKWFAHCSGDSSDYTVGCGWESEPTTYETREEAWAAAHTHIAESIKEVLTDART